MKSEEFPSGQLCSFHNARTNGLGIKLHFQSNHAPAVRKPISVLADVRSAWLHRTLDTHIGNMHTLDSASAVIGFI